MHPSDRQISIHVPTRGTTSADRNLEARVLFQSTCPRGARLCSPACLIRDTNFNPRAHEGHDAADTECRMSTGISIHVPTRGTTRGDVVGGRCRGISIHVPTRGTTRRHRTPNRPLGFQSTCPRGARPMLIRSNPVRLDFNPRAHEGHDIVMYDKRMAMRFQSTCPRGARLCFIFVVNDNCKFQSTCPRGARRHVHNFLHIFPDFNPRAHEGHDFRSQINRPYFIFQSTCPRGARRPQPHPSGEI